MAATTAPAGEIFNATVPANNATVVRGVAYITPATSSAPPASLPRNHLVPVPKVASLAKLNEKLAAADRADDARRIHGQVATIGERFDMERHLLRPLPFETFEPGLTLTPRVDRHSRIMVRNCQYSVPARFISRRVRVHLRSNELIVLDGRAEIARHERCSGRGRQVLVLDHYLEVLKYKPGALPGATALVQARDSGAFTSAHEAFWAQSRRVNGDAAGTRELIDVLLLHRSLPAGDVVAGIGAALGVGAVSADAVAVEARRHAGIHTDDVSQPGATAAELTPDGDHRVVSLTQRRLTDPAAVIAGLPADLRPAPTVNAYDELLARRRASPSEQNLSQESVS